MQKIQDGYTSSLLQSINREAFLRGERAEILKLGDIYSNINNLPCILPDEMKAYLAGKPLYLGEQTKAQWGMSLEDARRCLYDLPRTQKLIQGIVRGIQAMQSNTTEELRVIEAGGGTGILAIAAALSGARVTLLEINHETKEDTEKFIAFLGLEERIDVQLVDAARYVTHENFDMIICECLHTGLALEPQLQILHHLGKFLKPHGKLVPEGVHLRWALASVDWNGIPEQHVAQRDIQEKIYFVGEWGQRSSLDFKKAIQRNRLEHIQFIVPTHSVPANAVLVEMDVVISSDQTSPLVLQSGEAEFLGHPHVIKLQETISAREGASAFGVFPPGENFPTKLSPFRARF